MVEYLGLMKRMTMELGVRNHEIGYDLYLLEKAGDFDFFTTSSVDAHLESCKDRHHQK